VKALNFAHKIGFLRKAKTPKGVGAADRDAASNPYPDVPLGDNHGPNNIV
jgi:hypothetical protein